MDKLIYKDDQRTISLVSGCLEIYSGGKKFPANPRLDDMPNPVKPTGKHLTALKKAGKNPADYGSYLLPFGRERQKGASTTPGITTACWQRQT